MAAPPAVGGHVSAWGGSGPSHSAKAHPGADGGMVYPPDPATGDFMPDWSTVGYAGGGVALPILPAVETLRPGAASHCQYCQPYYHCQPLNAERSEKGDPGSS